MSEDLEALVKEARGLPRRGGMDARDTVVRLEFIRRLADALEASAERDRKLREAVREVVRQKDRMFGDHNVSRVALWDAIDVARQALDSGADR